MTLKICYLGGGGGESGLKLDFNHPWSYLRLQVEFGGSMQLYMGIGVVS